MALRKRLTHGQYFFLQTVRRHPEGLPMLHWPRASTMRRWLRTPLFLHAMLTLRESMRFEADFILAGTAVRSAKILSGILCEYTPEEKRYDQDKRIASLVRVLRTEHIRERETRPRANERVGRKAEALAAVQSVKAAREATPAIEGPLNVDPTPQLAATAGRMLVDVWGTLDRLLAEKPDDADLAEDGVDTGARAASD